MNDMHFVERAAAPRDVKIAARGVEVQCGADPLVRAVDMDIHDRTVTALIGPPGSGKSTFLRCLNRLNDTRPGCRVAGEILLNGVSITGASVDPRRLRARVGIVFRDPAPFPMSVHDNVAYGPRLHCRTGRLQATVEQALRRAGLWDELRCDLDAPAGALSPGQQQRLCIARALATGPEVLLMDDPCGTLDPISTARIEQLIDALRHDITVVVVTHSMQQAARVSQMTAFFNLGHLVEYGETGQIFTKPKDPRTESYITGRIG